MIAASPAILALVVGLLNKQQLGDVSRRVDGRLDELLRLTRAESHAEGVRDERVDAVVRRERV